MPIGTTPLVPGQRAAAWAGASLLSPPAKSTIGGPSSAAKRPANERDAAVTVRGITGEG